jgi:ribosomal protein S18 acetylase RimI-like enzyme
MTYRFRDLGDAPEPPNAATITRLAPWVVEASRPFADWYFGEPDVAAEIIEEWMSRPGSEVYAGRATLIEDDAGVARGCILTVPGHELTRCRAEDFASFCTEIEGEPEADQVIAEVMAASRELFPAVAGDDLYISRVAVDPTQRGRGLGQALVRRAIETARAGGLRGCRLDVSLDHPGAIRAYQAAGLTITCESHSDLARLTYGAMRTDV